jgi:DNA polymerase (family 10)
VAVVAPPRDLRFTAGQTASRERRLEELSRHPDRLSIARLLREHAQLLRALGESPFRVRAYVRGAEALEGLREDLGGLVAEGRLTSLPGIGPGLAAVVADLHRGGRSETLERVRGALPAGTLELLRVPSLTLPRIRALSDALGVASVEALEAACREGRVREVRGFGAVTERKLLEAIARRREQAGSWLLGAASDAAASLLEHLRAAPVVERAEPAGELRRRCETVSSLPIVVVAPRPEQAVDALSRHPLVERLDVREERGCEGMLAGGLPVSLAVAAGSDFAAAWLRRTGSPAHVARLESLAAQRGLALERSSSRPAAARHVGARDEPALYEALGLPWIPPELREDQGEIEAALAGELPPDLVTREDVLGAVHCHTRYSDGRNSVEEMARAAEAMGLRYITITDHSPSARYARGLTLDRLREQWDEIDGAQERVGIRILKGTESDILADGSLDYPAAVLERLDVIVASIHERHSMSEDAMTRRLVAAMRQPQFKIWGHALGRLIGRRAPLACRIDEVLDAAAGSRVAIEVNGNPRRLDMEPRLLRGARQRGLRFVLSSDAHSLAELGNLRFSVDMARRGWLRRGEVLNTLPVEAFAASVRPS